MSAVGKSLVEVETSRLPDVSPKLKTSAASVPHHEKRVVWSTSPPALRESNYVLTSPVL